MPSENTKNEGLERRQAIVDMLFERHELEPNAFSLYFPEDELLEHPLLKDIKALIKALEIMQEHLKPDFDFRDVWRGETPLVKYGALRNIRLGIEISVNNWGRLRVYRDELKEEELLPPIGKGAGIKNKIAITIDFSGGVFRTHDKSKLYPISGRRMNILIAISQERGAGVSQKTIMKSVSCTKAQISGAKNEINRLFKQKVGTPFDLIKQNSTRGGYHLNDEDYAIEIKNSV